MYRGRDAFERAGQGQWGPGHQQHRPAAQYPSPGASGAGGGGGGGGGSHQQQQLLCGGCRTLLVYVGTAGRVRCALCSTVNVAPTVAPEMSQLVCHGCSTLLMYARGASSVQCSVCHALNATQARSDAAHIDCQGCGVTLMYPAGALSVKCAVCDCIMNTGARGGGNRAGSAGQGSSSGGGPVEARPLVLIVNPGGDGDAMENIAVGRQLE